MLTVITSLATANAQTNGAPELPGFGLGPGAQTILQDFLALAPFTTNGQATVQFGAGKNTQTHEWVEAVAVTVPMTEHTAIGMGGYHFGAFDATGDWGVVNFNMSLGITNSLYFIGSVRTFAGDGVAYDCTQNHVANFAFAGQSKDWKLGEKFNAGVGYTAANISDRPGVNLLIGVHGTLKW